MKKNSLTTETKEILVQLIESISKLTFDEYTEKLCLLSNSSIGEHTRHIIELFQQLFIGYNPANVNYDERKRDVRLQEDIDFAVETIAHLINELEKPNKKLNIITLYNNQETIIESNYERELMYNIEHCIHHQAIIKIAFLSLKINIADENFGLAKSTIEYRKECVQ